MTRESLDRILGVPLNSIQWLQAQLPVSLGGVGLKSAEDHSSAAYASSKLSSQDLKEKILNLTEQDSPPNLSTPLLGLLSAKQGEEATLENLKWVAQKATRPANTKGLQITLPTMVHKGTKLDWPAWGCLTQGTG